MKNQPRSIHMIWLAKKRTIVADITGETDVEKFGNFSIARIYAQKTVTDVEIIKILEESFATCIAALEEINVVIVGQNLRMKGIEITMDRVTKVKSISASTMEQIHVEILEVMNSVLK